MRKVIVSEFLSLDGVMEIPERWVFKHIDTEIEKLKLEEMRESDSLLLGKATYQTFADSWPGRKGELAELMNGAKKYVASKTKGELAWSNSTNICGVADGVSALKDRSGKSILVVGSCSLVRALMELDLVDEYRFLVMPAVLDEVVQASSAGTGPGRPALATTSPGQEA